MKDFKKLTAYDETTRSVATDHTEPLKDIKDKPDFEAMAKESMKGMIEDDEDPDYEEGYWNGCNRIWNDYHIPLQKELERLQQNYDLQQGVLDSYRKLLEEAKLSLPDIHKETSQ